MADENAIGVPFSALGKSVVDDTTQKLMVDTIMSGASLTGATAAATDKAIIQDTDDSDNVKTVTLTDLVAAGGGGGGWAFISKVDASAASSVNFDNMLDSTYNAYKVVWYEVLASVGSSTVNAQYGTGGTPTYATTNYATRYIQALSTSTLNTAISASTNFLVLSLTLGTAQDGNVGEVLFANANKASGYTGSTGRSNSQNQLYITGGQWTTNSVATSIKFLPPSGTLTGTFILYGLKQA